MTHPPDTLLQEFADDELPAARQADVAGHLADCAGCRQKIARLGRLRRRLREVVDVPAAIPEGFPTVGMVKRRGKAGGMPFVLRAAAAVLVFGVGYVAGAGRALPNAAAPVLTAAPDPAGTAADVQRIGSEYVAALAAVDTETGIEVAGATLRGATAEFARIAAGTTTSQQPTVRF